MTIKKKYHSAIKEYNLNDGTTLYRFTVYLGVDPYTGKDKIVTRSKFRTPKVAQLAIDRLKYEFNNGHTPEDMRKTFIDGYLEWVEIYKNSGIVMSTYSKTEGYFKNHILPFFGQMKVSKITVRHCEQFALQLSKKLKYFQHIINYASDVMETAIRYGYINSNPFKNAKIPKEKVHEINDNYLDVEDFKQLIFHLPSLDLKVHALLRLLAFTGIRKGELLVLTWSDINLKKKTISIHEAYSYSKYNEGNNVGLTKGKLSRIIVLEDVTLDILKQWDQEQSLRLTQLGILKNTDEKQLIFSNSNNNYLKLNFPNDQLSSVINKLKLKYITVHGLRHTHATHLHEAGASLIGIQDRLGHAKNSNTTHKFYTHVTDKIKGDTPQSLIKYYKEFGIY